MKRQSILFILLLLLNIFVCCGCSTKEPEESAVAEQPAVVSTLETKDAVATDSTENSTEDVLGIFEGLEGNHTAIFSFDGVETAFHFEDPEVQTVLFEAIAGSSYTLSYYLDPATGLSVIYEISE